MRDLHEILGRRLKVVMIYWIVPLSEEGGVSSTVAKIQMGPSRV